MVSLNHNIYAWSLTPVILREQVEVTERLKRLVVRENRLAMERKGGYFLQEGCTRTTRKEDSSFSNLRRVGKDIVCYSSIKGVMSVVKKSLLDI